MRYSCGIRLRLMITDISSNRNDLVMSLIRCWASPILADGSFKNILSISGIIMSLVSNFLTTFGNSVMTKFAS